MSAADDHQPTPQSVLEFLRLVIERARLEHRPDIEREYEEAWELAVRHIYGPLPPRKPLKGHYPPEEKPKTTPPWRAAMLAKPLRRIVARDGDDEILSCGHRHWNPEWLNLPEAKKRRCEECRTEAVAKKQPEPAAADPKNKAASA